MTEERTWNGGCHCGAVRYRVDLELEGAVSCNCSICQKTGTMLAFVPAAKFELLSGADAIADYQFGKKQVHHLFCRHCGVRSFGRGAMPDGQPMVAVNVRCLDGVEIEKVPVHAFDGRSIPSED